jgi:hypothetical protein
LVSVANIEHPGKKPWSYHKEGTSMTDDKLRQKLADYVEDAHAIEQNDLKLSRYRDNIERYAIVGDSALLEWGT